MPPPADGLASRLFLGPALRAQPDRRLVTLVREGYESAFEEIVRRYGRPLGRYAASIVGGRSEDVLQDAFAKALPALQRDDAEIELRPWLFRIVRNTALNDLRDSPPTAEALAERLAGGGDPAEELERREQLADLMRRLRELPEAQRAAIVMRELEGLGHDEIAAALGLSGGGARQAIYRARQALRDGAGLLLPLPLLRLLLDHGAEAASAGTGGAIAAAGATAGGAGAGGAVKAGVVAAVLAGSVGAGVAVHENRGGEARAVEPAAAAASTATGAPEPTDAEELFADDDSGQGGNDERGSENENHRHRDGDDSSGRHEARGGPGPGSEPPHGHRGHGSGEQRLRPPERGGHSGPGGGGRDDRLEGDGRHGGSDSSGPGGGELREPRPEDRSGPDDGQSPPPPEVEEDRSGESDTSGSGESGGSGTDSGGRSGEPG